MLLVIVLMDLFSYALDEVHLLKPCFISGYSKARHAFGSLASNRQLNLWRALPSASCMPLGDHLKIISVISPDLILKLGNDG